MAVSRKNNILTQLANMTPSAEAIFVQINKNTVVNVLMTEEFCRDNKGYFVRMRQDAGAFEVGRAYNKKVVNYFKMPHNQ